MEIRDRILSAHHARRCLALASDIALVLRAALGVRRTDAVVVVPTRAGGQRATVYVPEVGLTLLGEGDTRLAALTDLQIRVHDLRRALAALEGDGPGDAGRAARAN